MIKWKILFIHYVVYSPLHYLVRVLYDIAYSDIVGDDVLYDYVYDIVVSVALKVDDIRGILFVWDLDNKTEIFIKLED